MKIAILGKPFDDEAAPAIQALLDDLAARGADVRIGEAFRTFLDNRLLGAVGFGLHLVTFYDRVFTAEYTLNRLGQTGYFFRASFPI